MLPLYGEQRVSLRDLLIIIQVFEVLGAPMHSESVECKKLLGFRRKDPVQRSQLPLLAAPH